MTSGSGNQPLRGQLLNKSLSQECVQGGVNLIKQLFVALWYSNPVLFSRQYLTHSLENIVFVNITGGYRRVADKGINLVGQKGNKCHADFIVAHYIGSIYTLSFIITCSAGLNTDRLPER